VEVGSHPDDVAPELAEHVQGISHGAGFWYVTQADRVWRFPIDLDLASARDGQHDVRKGGIPEPGIEHLGDCDVHDGLLYVAMEGTDPPLVGLFDLDLRFLGSAPLTAQPTKDPTIASPWCAIDPRDGLLYSSRFYTDRLQAYRRHVVGGAFELEPAREVLLQSEDGERLHLDRVQGADFTSKGHLYLTSDTPDGGLLGFDVATGQRHLHRVIPFEPGWPQEEVIEGLTVVDLADGGVPWMRGVIHVLAFDGHERRPDYVWLRHFDVADPRERELF